MKRTINFYEFERAFKDAGRGEQFSYEALQAMFERIEDYEQDSGEELELDVIGLCCDWAEDDTQSIAEYYNIDLTDGDGENTLDDDEKLEAVLAYLQYHTSHAVSTAENTILYVQF